MPNDASIRSAGSAASLRVTVTMLLSQLAGGRAVEQPLADHPCLEREDVLAALEHAAAVVDQQELPLARSA